MYGLKLDETSEPDDVYAVTLTIMTDISPIWGDFWGKDGNLSMGGGDIAALNLGYASQDPDIMSCLVISTNADAFGDCAWGFLAVPDSTIPGTEIPEPSTFALFGIGLAGLGVLMRRRRRLAAVA